MQTMRTLFAATLLLLPLMQASAQDATLDRIRSNGRITLGYSDAARPFAFRDDSGDPAGYAVALCERVADAVRAAVGQGVQVQWTPVTAADRFAAVEQGRIDLLCGSDDVSLSRRQDVSFSVPIYQGGISAVLRTDAPLGLKDALGGRDRPYVFWRAAPADVLNQQTFAAVANSTGADWLGERLATLKIDAEVTTVSDVDAGIVAVLVREADAFFAERSVLLAAAGRSTAAEDLVVLDRRFSSVPLAFAMQRGSEDFRLLVDRVLSETYRSEEFPGIYGLWFGEMDEAAQAFFQGAALSD